MVKAPQPGSLLGTVLVAVLKMRCSPLPVGSTVSKSRLPFSSIQRKSLRKAIPSRSVLGPVKLFWTLPLESTSTTRSFGDASSTSQKLVPSCAMPLGVLVAVNTKMVLLEEAERSGTPAGAVATVVVGMLKANVALESAKLATLPVALGSVH